MSAELADDAIRRLDLQERAAKEALERIAAERQAAEAAHRERKQREQEFQGAIEVRTVEFRRECAELTARPFANLSELVGLARALADAQARYLNAVRALAQNPSEVDQGTIAAQQAMNGERASVCLSWLADLLRATATESQPQSSQGEPAPEAGDGAKRGLADGGKRGEQLRRLK